MALAASGAMSLAGTTANRSIAVELGRAGTAQTSLGESAVRGLLGVASGAISMSNAYGKSDVDPITQPYRYTYSTATYGINSTGYQVPSWIAGDAVGDVIFLQHAQDSGDEYNTITQQGGTNPFLMINGGDRATVLVRNNTLTSGIRLYRTGEANLNGRDIAGVVGGFRNARVVAIWTGAQRNGTTVRCSSASNVQAGDVVVCGFGQDDVNFTWNAPTGFTLVGRRNHSSTYGSSSAAHMAWRTYNSAVANTGAINWTGRNDTNPTSGFTALLRPSTTNTIPSTTNDFQL